MIPNLARYHFFPGPTLQQLDYMGIDCLGPRILKECAHILFQPLHHLFCLSLSSHSIPEEWRIHQITPIHKSGDRSLVSNYRPISLLCSISKVLERIIYTMFSGLFLVPFLPVSLVSLGTDPLLSNSSPFSTACMNLSKPRLNLMLYTLISGRPSTASPIMSFFSNSGVLASEAISGAGSKCIYPTECNVLLLTAIPLVCYLCYLVFPKGAFLVKIQLQASKYILSDFSSDYKSRLTSLNMLPLMMQLELYDIFSYLLSHSSIHQSHSMSLTLSPPDLRLTSNFSFLQPIVQPTV